MPQTLQNEYQQLSEAAATAWENAQNNVLNNRAAAYQEAIKPYEELAKYVQTNSEPNQSASQAYLFIDTLSCYSCYITLLKLVDGQAHYSDVTKKNEWVTAYFECLKKIPAYIQNYLLPAIEKYKSGSLTRSQKEILQYDFSQLKLPEKLASISSKLSDEFKELKSKIVPQQRALKTVIDPLIPKKRKKLTTIVEETQKPNVKKKVSSKSPSLFAAVPDDRKFELIKHLSDCTGLLANPDVPVDPNSVKELQNAVTKFYTENFSKCSQSLVSETSSSAAP